MLFSCQDIYAVVAWNKIGGIMSNINGKKLTNNCTEIAQFTMLCLVANDIKL
jgi:hypothetical protein